MNFRTTILLSALLAGLLSFVYFYEAKLPSPEEKESAAQKLIAFNPAEVTRFQIHVGNTVTVCEREKAAWKLKHPIQAEADSEKIDELFWNLLDARSVRSVELEEPIGEPRAEFTLWVDEKPIRLQFGENTPLGPNLYVKIEGESQARVAPATLFAQLILNPEDLRDKRVFDFNVEHVSRLEVRSPEGEVKLEKKAGRWEIGGAPCDEAKVENFLYRLKGLRVLDFLPTPPTKKEKTGLDKPQIVIAAAQEEEASPVSLSLGAIKEEAVYARGGIQKEIFTLSVQEKDPLAVTANDFKIEKAETVEKKESP